MTPAYQRSEHDHDDEPQNRWAIRRAGDRCFHEAEEFVPGQGYIVQGVLVPLDEVVDVRPQEGSEDGGCRRSAS